MGSRLLKQLQEWHEQDEYQKIVDAIKAIPKEKWDYDMISHLARAYNNLEKYQDAITLLQSIRTQGLSDPLWHFRMGYAYYYLDEIPLAMEEFEQVLKDNPDDQDAKLFFTWCQQEMEQQQYDPELYTEEEMETVERHISNYFGSYEHVFHELISPDIHVDICIIPPTPSQDYYKLVTLGMGAHQMNVPLELEEKKLERAELMICLPPDWEIQNSDEKWYWPLRWLKILARLPGEQDTWLGWGHTVPNGGPFAENTQLSGIMLLNPGAFPPEASCCVLPNGDEINFYQVIPLYEEEMQFKIKHSADELLKEFTGEQLEYVHLNRPNLHGDNEGKTLLLSPEELQPLLENWEGPDLCIASDRITVEGYEVGYCYRIAPNDKQLDSGWCFLAGDETEEYLTNQQYMSRYDLNTICNYDPDIIPLLNSAYGSAFYRDENGIFQKCIEITN